MLVITVGDEQVLFALDTLSDKAKDLSNVFQRIARDLMSLETEIFTTQGAIIGQPWAPLSPKTIRQKQRKGFPLDTLVRTGRLKASLTDESSDEMVLDIQTDALTFGSARLVDRGDWFLAPIHHYGAKSGAIPARALMPDEQRLAERFRERWMDYFLNHLSEEGAF